MPREPSPNDPPGNIDDADAFLEPGGVFEGPLWQDLLAEGGALAVGTHLGPYEIRAPIGAGGMGEVYRAYDTRLTREVALKVLPRYAVDSPQAMARFQREARAVAALNHPNILAIHDIGSAGDVHFAVTELLEGETLHARLSAGRPLAPSKAIEYAIQIAHGLAAAHDRGIVHRDLKPANIFVVQAGRVKILDFGVALYDRAPAANDETVAPLTQAGLVVGTIGYISPEQILGSPATARSDLFALGVVMYEMLTGTHPFRRATTPETQTAILREDPAPIARSAPGVPPAVIRIVDLCLQKHPPDRPESARDLALFLEAMGNASAAWPADGELPALRTSPRLRARLLAIACGLLLLVTGATWGVVRVIASRAVDEVIESDLTRAERVVRRVQREHLQRLALTARLVASFPELRALFGTDVATIEDFLRGFQQLIPGLPVLVALGREGAVLARTDDRPSNATGEDWGAALTTSQTEGTVLTVNNRPSLAVAVASEAGGTIFGYIVAAEAINQTFAEALSEATQDEVVLLSDQTVLASTLRDVQTPWRSLQAWQADEGRATRFVDVQIGPERYAAREITLASDPAVSAIIVKSKDEAIGPYVRIQRGLVVIGVSALALVLLGGLWMSRTLRNQRTPARREEL
jgi:tRNA A-37 threonylcarbamoyl transferase component Bud32